jgi:hypothetical protein
MLSILIATYNGSDRLRVTLPSLARLSCAPEPHEFIIIDNGSTDDTRDLVNCYGSRMPVKYIYEPRRGKNVALNTGIKHLGGDLVLFTDDDVIPEDNWLVSAQRIADQQPEFAIFGGIIEPLWQQEPPAWLFEFTNPNKRAVLYAITSPDWKEGPIAPNRIWGPNMLVRARIFREGHLFDELIGPDGTKAYRMGSETEFTTRMAALGFRCWHTKELKVKHIIRAEQVNIQWIYQRAYPFCKRKFHVDKSYQNKIGLFICGVAPSEWLTMFKRICKFVIAKSLGNEKKTFSARWDLEIFRGVFSEARRSSRGRAESYQSGS